MTSRACLTILGFVVAALAPRPALAQGAGNVAAMPAHQMLDRVVAIVGTTPILFSQVEEQLLLEQSQGAKVPEDSVGRGVARRQILEQMVDEELMVQEAERDTSIRVTEQEVQDEVEKTVANVHKQFTSQQDFLTQLRGAGFGSEEEWRRWLADNQRRSILQQRLIEELRGKNKLRPIPPTEAELHSFWAQDATQRPKHPPLVSYRQIIIDVQPDSVAKARARFLADSLVIALRHGASFPDAAKRFSADSASRVQGGELGWFRRGVMVKAFEDAAFHLKPGDVSDVVETQFGYHIIQVERAEPAEIEARHILLQPQISPAQMALAHRLADSVRAALTAGAPFDTLAKRVGDPSESRLADAVPVNQLPASYPKELATDSVPGLLPTFQIDSITGRPKLVVLEVTRWEPEGELTFADVKDRIRDQVGQRLAVQHYLEILRRTTYIDVRL